MSIIVENIKVFFAKVAGNKSIFRQRFVGLKRLVFQYFFVAFLVPRRCFCVISSPPFLGERRDISRRHPLQFPIKKSMK